MNIQIIGHKKCNNTKKAIRFFKERNIRYHFLDLAEKALSKGELDTISRSIPIDDLIDTTSKEYIKKGYAYREFDTAEELLLNPALIKTPIVRNGNEAVVGNQPEIWKEWISNA